MAAVSRITCLFRLLIIGCILLKEHVHTLEIVATFRDRVPHGQLRHLVRDNVTQHLYVGAKNRIYDLGNDLSVVHTLTMGPHMDSLQCPPDPTVEPGCHREHLDNYNQVLAMDTANRLLIACNTLYYGSCSKIRLSDFQEQDTVYRPVVPNSENLPVIGFVAPGVTSTGNLYIGAMRSQYGYALYLNMVPMLSSRQLSNLDLANKELTSQSSVDILATYRNTYAMHYKHGFSYHGSVYFLAVQNKEPGSNEYVTRLSRVCEQDGRFFSFIEVDITCEQSGIQYNAVQAAQVTRPGRLMAQRLQLQADEQVLFATFSKTNPSSLTLSEKTAVCAYSMEHIVSVLHRNYRACFKGETNAFIGPEQLHLKQSCIRTNYEIPRNYCGDKDLNHPLAGLYPISPEHTIGIATNQPITGLAVKGQGDYTLAFLGTNNGHLLKVLLNHDGGGYTYEDMTVDTGNPIQKDMVFDLDYTHLFVMTPTMVHKVLLSKCDIHASCEKCIGVRDPHCGWCTGNHRCTNGKDCGATWLPYDSSCPHITEISPTAIPVEQEPKPKITVTLLTMPDSDQILCSLSHMSWLTTSEASPIDYKQQVVCEPFPELPPIPSDKDYINATLSILVDKKVWVSAHLPVYKCSTYNSCSSCTNTTWPCVWCVEDGACISQVSLCSKPQAVIGNEHVEVQSNAMIVSSSEAMSALGPDQCPHLQPLQHKYLEASGELRQFSATGRHIMIWQKPQGQWYNKRVYCVFSLVGGSHTVRKDANVTAMGTAEFMGDGRITCQPVTLAYSSDDPYVRYKFDVYWEFDKPLDNMENINIEVYKCADLVLNCGNCLTLDDEYSCGWCASTKNCQLQKHCSSNWLDNTGTCPDPHIHSFSPMSGPINGDTKVTVNGSNLGTRWSQLQGGVNIGNVQCQVVLTNYDPANSFVCITHATSAAYSAPLSVTVNNMYNTTSTQNFSFKEPVFTDVMPRQGLVFGGTLVAIKGRDLNIGNKQRVFLDSDAGRYSQEAELVNVTASKLLIRTPAVSGPGSVRMRVTIDGSEGYYVSGSFVYKPNPVLYTIRPMAMLVSGGNHLNITGINLAPVQHAGLRLELNVRRKRSLKLVKRAVWAPISRCQIQDDTNMVCLTPSLLEAMPDFSKAQEVDFSFIFDTVLLRPHNLTSLEPHYKPLMLYPDPEIYPLSTVARYNSSMKVVIKGKNLHILRIFMDTAVTVGGSPCLIISALVSQAVCIPPSSPMHVSADGTAVVLVKQGYLEVQVGYIRYKDVGGGTNVGLIVGIVLAVCFCIGLLIAILLILRRRRKRHRKAKVPLAPPDQRGGIAMAARASDKEIPPEEVPLKSYTDDDNRDLLEVKEPDTYIRGLLGRIESNRLRQAVKEVIIARERLEMGELLGQGNYGCVYAATLKDENMQNPAKCAVKTLQGDDFDALTIQAFLKEGTTMWKFEHPHVLRLLGVCVNLQAEPMIITPFMAHGDLRTYIKDKSKNFTARQLLQLSQQVAEGMAYLASLNFVHRDLAARNCMIDEDEVVKVADFGLSKNLYEKEYYSIRERKAKLPVKWMALESLEDFTFTDKADVWSFGVLVWELMTRGVTPYPDVDAFNLRDYLSSGRRLRKPKYCPDEVYRIMHSCWEAIPERRPTFADLVNRIELLLNPPRRPQETNESGEPMYINITETDAAEYLNPISPPPNA